MTHKHPDKAEALKRLIVQTLNGEKYAPNMAIHVIKYLLPSQDHAIKKLLLIYWEIVPKVDEEGKLRDEMILVCDAYRHWFTIYDSCMTHYDSYD